MLSLFFYESGSSSVYQKLTITFKTSNMHRALEKENLKVLSLSTSLPSKYQSPSIKKFQVTHNLRRNVKQSLLKKKKKASVASLKLKLARKKNLRKIQGKHYFVNYSNNRIFFPPRASMWTFTKQTSKSQLAGRIKAEVVPPVNYYWFSKQAEKRSHVLHTTCWHNQCFLMWSH